MQQLDLQIFSVHYMCCNMLCLHLHVRHERMSCAYVRLRAKVCTSAGRCLGVWQFFGGHQELLRVEDRGSQCACIEKV